MKGKPVFILLLTILSLVLIIAEIIHFFSAKPSKKEKVPVVENQEQTVTKNNAAQLYWNQYSFFKNADSDNTYLKIISSYPRADTLFPSDILPGKRLRMFEDTLKGNRICIFRPTSPDARYGEWVILPDSAAMITKLSAVKIDTSVNITGNRTVIIFKKEKSGLVFRDTIGIAD